jgi:hypothetical protein
MDMKRILQAMDTASTKPVEGVSDMAKFVKVIAEANTLTESKDRKTNRLTAAEAIAVQHYTQKRPDITSPVLNVREGATPSMIGKYFKQVEQELDESAERSKERAHQLAKIVAKNINEGSRLNEKSKSQAQFRTMAAVANNPEFAKKVGIKPSVGKEFHKADKKQDYKKLPKKVKEAEGTPEGVPHLTKELLTHIVQQSGKEGAHAVVKSLEWGDGASKELLHLIIDDLKDDIKGMDEASSPAQQAAIAISKKKEKKADESLKSDNPCWKGYHPVGTKKKGGRTVPNCVPK